MPARKGYHGKHMDDRSKSPGKVKSGKVTVDAYGPQKPLGTVSMAPRAREQAKGY